MRRCIAIAAIALIGFTAARVAAECEGDCDRDGMVSIAEVTNGVAIALGEASLALCSLLDDDGNGLVTIDELLRAVALALHGCPVDATATVTPIDTPNATPTPTPADRLLTALQRAFAAVCQPRQLVYVRSNDFGYSGYYGFCEAAAEHRTQLRIERFENVEDAGAGFAGASLGPPYDFHEFPAAYWERGGGRLRTLVWQLDCWVIAVESYDAFGDFLAPSPMETSDAILDAGRELFTAGCPSVMVSPTPSPTKGPEPDLVAADLYVTRTGGGSCRGPFAALSVCVANAGRSHAEAFSIRVSPGDDRFTVNGLLSGEETCLQRPIPVLGFATATIDVDVADAVQEADEGNNQLSKSLAYPTVPATCSPTRLPTSSLAPTPTSL